MKNIIVFSIGKRLKLIRAWWSYFFLGPEFWSLVLVTSAPFSFVTDKDNRYIFEWINNLQGPWISFVKLASPLLFFLALFGLCINIETSKLEDKWVYEQERKRISDWFNSRLPKKGLF